MALTFRIDSRTQGHPVRATIHAAGQGDRPFELWACKTCPEFGISLSHHSMAVFASFPLLDVSGGARFSSGIAFELAPVVAGSLDS